MNGLNEKEQAMRNYWLGILTGSQTDFFETQWFGDDLDTELLEIARADLIDDYLSENLNEAELSQFEKNFLLDNLADVALAKASLQISMEHAGNSEKKDFFEGFRVSLRNFIRLPQIAAAVLLLVCFGLWFKFYDNDFSRQTAQNAEPPVNLENTSRADSENGTNSDINRANHDNKDIVTADSEGKNENTGANKKSPEMQNPGINRNSKIIKKHPKDNTTDIKPQAVFLTVFRGSVKTVGFTDQQKFFTLKLTMPGIDKAYKNYQLKIYDEGNLLIVKQDLGSKLSLKKSGEILTMPPLECSLFKKNNLYKTHLIGIDENGEEIELISYDNFRIE